MITTKGDLITTGEWLLGVSGDCCLGPTDNSVGVWSRADFTALQRRSDFTINHQLCMSGCGWRPRTDAAKCDTHFYILFQLGNISLEDFSHRVIDTVLYRARLSGFIYLLFTPGRTLPGGDQQDQRTGGRDLLFYYLLWAFMPTTRAWTSGGAIQRLFGGYRRRTITGGRSCWRDASQFADVFFY